MKFESAADRFGYSPLATRTLKYMGLMIFLLSVGEGLTAPAIPLYGGKLGASYWQLGFLMTGYSITYTLMTVTSGRISDRIGRKKILLFSLAISIIASAGYYFSSVPLSLMVFRILEGMSRGILWPISEAIVAENTTLEGRSVSMGRFTAAYGSGVTIGTLAGGYLMDHVGITAVFPFYPVLSAVVLVTTILGISESETSDYQHSFELGISKSSVKEEIKKIWPICSVGFAYSGFLYALWGLLSVVADSFAVSYTGIGVIFAIFWGGRLVAFLLSGELSLNLGRKRALILGITLCIFSSGTFLRADTFSLLILAATMGGLGTGLTFPLLVTLVADTVSSSFEGLGTGFLEFIMGIGMIVQTALSGILGQVRGVQSTYLFTFIVTIVSLVVAVIFIQETRPEDDTAD